MKLFLILFFISAVFILNAASAIPGLKYIRKSIPGQKLESPTYQIENAKSENENDPEEVNISSPDDLENVTPKESENVKMQRPADLAQRKMAGVDSKTVGNSEEMSTLSANENFIPKRSPTHRSAQPTAVDNEEMQMSKPVNRNFSPRRSSMYPNNLDFADADSEEMQMTLPNNRNTASRRSPKYSNNVDFTTDADSEEMPIMDENFIPRRSHSYNNPDQFRTYNGNRMPSMHQTGENSNSMRWRGHSNNYRDVSPPTDYEPVLEPDQKAESQYPSTAMKRLRQFAEITSVLANIARIPKPVALQIDSILGNLMSNYPANTNVGAYFMGTRLLLRNQNALRIFDMLDAAGLGRLEELVSSMPGVFNPMINYIDQIFNRIVAVTASMIQRFGQVVEGLKRSISSMQITRNANSYVINIPNKIDMVVKNEMAVAIDRLLEQLQGIFNRPTSAGVQVPNAEVPVRNSARNYHQYSLRRSRSSRNYSPYFSYRG